MNPIDELELLALEIGDIELAELAGRVARDAIRAAVETLAVTLGLDPAAMIADVGVAMGIDLP